MSSLDAVVTGYSFAKRPDFSYVLSLLGFSAFDLEGLRQYLFDMIYGNDNHSIRVGHN